MEAHAIDKKRNLPKVRDRLEHKLTLLDKMPGGVEIAVIS